MKGCKMSQKQQKYVKPAKFTFFNSGTQYSFDPKKKTNMNNEFITLLELHKREVEFRNSPDVFILDDTGTPL